MLVRQTGVGISATIDDSRARTNQVVYIFRVKEEYRNQSPLEVLLAILNSRAMYYYVAKTHGETEWRSHPYVTQQQILELPLPNIGSLISDSAKRVASLLRTALTGQLGVLPALDSRIERFVARAFRLGPVDYTRIYQTLSTVEQLLPVQALVRIGPGDIFTASI